MTTLIRRVSNRRRSASSVGSTITARSIRRGKSILRLEEENIEDSIMVAELLSGDPEDVQYSARRRSRPFKRPLVLESSELPSKQEDTSEGAIDWFTYAFPAIPPRKKQKSSTASIVTGVASQSPEMSPAIDSSSPVKLVPAVDAAGAGRSPIIDLTGAPLTVSTKSSNRDAAPDIIDLTNGTSQGTCGLSACAVGRFNQTRNPLHHKEALRPLPLISSEKIKSVKPSLSKVGQETHPSIFAVPPEESHPDKQLQIPPGSEIFDSDDPPPGVAPGISALGPEQRRIMLNQFGGWATTKVPAVLPPPRKPSRTATSIGVSPKAKLGRRPVRRRATQSKQSSGSSKKGWRRRPRKSQVSGTSPRSIKKRASGQGPLNVVKHDGYAYTEPDIPARMLRGMDWDGF